MVMERPTVQPLQAKTIARLGTGGLASRWRPVDGGPQGCIDPQILAKGFGPSQIRSRCQTQSAFHVGTGWNVARRAVGEAAGRGAGRSRNHKDLQTRPLTPPQKHPSPHPPSGPTWCVAISNSPSIEMGPL